MSLGKGEMNITEQHRENIANIAHACICVRL